MACSNSVSPTPRRPRIGVTTGLGPAWEEGSPGYEPYAAAVREAGGDPVRMPPELADRAISLLDELGLDAVLLTGGLDVHPMAYGVPPAPGDDGYEGLIRTHRIRVEMERDALEVPLARAALAAGRPVLGICRGCQLLNVALGGSLVMDIPNQLPEAGVHTAGTTPDRPSSRHDVTIAAGTLLEQATGLAGPQPANSRHHQAAAFPLPDGVVASAVSSADGVVEAIEAPGRGFVLGVQWHPEREADADVRARFRQLFSAFVTAAARRPDEETQPAAAPARR